MSIESIKMVIVTFGFIASFIAWIACVVETTYIGKGSLYFAGIAAASALMTFGVML